MKKEEEYLKNEKKNYFIQYDITSLNTIALQ